MVVTLIAFFVLSLVLVHMGSRILLHFYKREGRRVMKFSGLFSLPATLMSLFGIYFFTLSKSVLKKVNPDIANIRETIFSVISSLSYALILALLLIIFWLIYEALLRILVRREEPALRYGSWPWGLG